MLPPPVPPPTRLLAIAEAARTTTCVQAAESDRAAAAVPRLPRDHAAALAAGKPALRCRILSWYCCRCRAVTHGHAHRAPSLQLPELAEFEVGMANLFVQHTSCSLTINENASPGGCMLAFCFLVWFYSLHIHNRNLRHRHARGGALLCMHDA